MTTISLCEPLSPARSRSCCINRQRVGQALHFFAQQLFRPLHWSSGAIRALITPIDPRFPGNSSNKGCEVATRVVSVVSRLLVSPITLASALTGGVVQCAGSAIAPHPYYYIRGDAKEKNEEPVRFFNLNACMFWGDLPRLFGGVFPAEKRMKALFSLITKINPTIFVAQEVAFGPGLMLANALKPYYTHIFIDVGPNPFRMESGLFIAARCHLTSIPYFKAFPNQPGIKRGIFCFETRKFSVITTHLESGDAFASAEKIRKGQFEILSRESRKLADNRNPCFILGDFNCSREEIPRHLFDPYARQYPTVDATSATCTNALTSWMRGKKPKEDHFELDDYTLVEATGELPEMAVELVQTFDLRRPAEAVTDHHGLLLTVKGL